jgi:hypothetical protein
LTFYFDAFAAKLSHFLEGKISFSRFQEIARDYEPHASADWRSAFTALSFHVASFIGK